MRVIILVLFFLSSTLICNSQRIFFANRSIQDYEPYKIIGEVNNNIIVWTIKNDQNTSEILVYNNRLNFIRSISSGILKSTIDPNPEFFNISDSFAVVYQYQAGNKWQYRLTFFDDYATQLSTIIIDSSIGSEPKKDNNKFFYKFLQSQDKKTICCTKITINADSFVAKINCTFFNKQEVLHEQFFLPFDILHENIDDFLVDSNKNIVLLETINSDSSFFVKLVKKDFSKDYLLIASKKISSGNLMNGSVHITDKPDSYIVYGCWQNKSKIIGDEKGYITGFYKWTTDIDLNDKPGDTILNRNVSNATTAYSIYIKTNNKVNDFFAIQQQYVSVNLSYGNPMPNYSTPENSDFNVEKEAIRNFRQLPSSNGKYVYIVPNAPDYNYSQPPNTLDNKTLANKSITAFDLFSLNNLNKIEWLNDLISDNYDLSHDFNNEKIVAGKNAIHIIYSEELKTNKTGISQVIISYNDGTYKKDNIPIWNSEYKYLLNQATEISGNAIIIPCMKSGKIVFAKMIFE